MRRRRWHPTQVLLPGKSMDGGAWSAAVHGVTKSQTRLSGFTFTFYFHALEKEMATHSSVLAWRIPGTGEPGGLPSVGSHRVGHDWSDLAAAAEVFHCVHQPSSIISSSISGHTFWLLDLICYKYLRINIWVPIFHSFGYRPSCGIAGSHDNSVLIRNMLPSHASPCSFFQPLSLVKKSQCTEFQLSW